MAGLDDYIQLPVDSTGKKVRGWKNTVGANDVYAQAMVLTDIDGVVQTSATGIWVGGHVAHDAVDAGNPLKIGGYAKATLPTAVADADRVNAWFTPFGAQAVANVDPVTGDRGNIAVHGDAASNGIFGMYVYNRNIVYNGSSWDRMRGDTNGLYVGGNVAHDAVDAGNPIKIGGKAESTSPAAVADNDRVDAWFSTLGGLSVFLTDGSTNSKVEAGNPADATSARYGLSVLAESLVYNGSTWDRMRNEGSTLGLTVGGSVAHNAVDAGNPIKIGGKASNTANNISTGNRVDAWFDSYGKLAVANLQTGSGIDAFSNSLIGIATALASNSSLMEIVGARLFNGTSWDRIRSIESPSAAPNVKTGILAVGVGPGFDIKLNPSNLATAVNSAITNTVDGASSMIFYIGTSTTGTYAIEGTADDTNWVTIYDIEFLSGGIWMGEVSSGKNPAGITPTSGDTFHVNVSQYRQVRLRTVTTLGATMSVRQKFFLGPRFVNARISDRNGTDLVLSSAASDAFGFDALKTVPTTTVLYGYNGSTFDRVRTANTGRLQVDVVTAPSSATAGDIAHDSPDSGSPVKIGGYAKATAPTDVSGDADRVNAWFLRNGAQATVLTAAGALIGGDATNGLDVDVTRAQNTSGTAAKDAPVNGNPVYVGSRASDTVPTAVSADDDMVPFWLTLRGAQIVSNVPHIGLDGAPYTLVNKTVQTTSTQTGTDVWTPASGKKICVTSYQIQAGGTVAGTVQLWFGANADTTYTRGTDYAIFDGEFAPSSTLKPGVVQVGTWISSTADHEIHLTTSAAINPLTITLWGYEF